MKKVRMFLVLVSLFSKVAVNAANKALAPIMTTPSNGKYTLMAIWPGNVEDSLTKCTIINDALNKAKFHDIKLIAFALELRDLVKTITASDARFSEKHKLSEQQ